MEDDRFYAALLHLVEAKEFTRSRLPEVMVTEALAFDGQRTANQVRLLVAVCKGCPTIFREVSARRLEQGRDKQSVEELLTRVEMVCVPSSCRDFIGIHSLIF
jgi:hypothetical protein